MGISTSAKSDGASDVSAGASSVVDRTTKGDCGTTAVDRRGKELVKASEEATSAKRTVKVAETIFILTFSLVDR